MDIMDPYTSELLAAPAPPGGFSGCGGDDYLRAIGALPRRRARADFEPSSVMLPAPWDLFAAVQPAVEVSVQQPLQMQRDRKRVAPVSDVAGSKISAKRPRICPWVPDYDLDIDINLREKERNVKLHPSPDYLKTVQGDRIDEQTRSNLVAQMDELTKDYGLAPGTLHRAVSYVDRFLSLSKTNSDYELRLLGATAVFTAAKYEDRSTILKLKAWDVVGYCGFETSKEVIDMEREVLATLRYELSDPTAYTFVDHFTRNSRGQRNMEIRKLAHHLAETSLRDYGCLQFMPSAVAATALLVARRTLNPADNQEYFEDLTGYKPTDLVDGMRSLLKTNPNSSSVILPALRQFM